MSEINANVNEELTLEEILLAADESAKKEAAAKVGLEIRVAIKKLAVANQKMYATVVKKAKKKSTGIQHLHIKLNRDKSADLERVKMGENNFTRMCKMGNVLRVQDKMMLDLDGECHMFLGTDRYPITTDIISVSIGQNKEFYKLLVKGVFGVRGATGTMSFFVKEGNGLVSVRSGEKVKPGYTVYQEDGETLKPGICHYMVLGSTPSMVRSMQFLMIDINRLGWDGIKELLSKTTQEAYDLLESKNGEAKDAKDAIKCFARMFQCLAPHVQMGEVKCWALYNGKWADSEKNEFADGLAYVLDEYMAEITSGIINALVTSKAASGGKIQGRVFKMVKASFDAIPRASMVAMLNTMGESVRIPSSMMGDKDYVASVVAENPDKLIIFGDGFPNFVVDLNTLKADFNYSESLKQSFDVLDVGQASNAKTSIQMLQKLVLADPELVKALISRLAETDIENTIGRLRTAKNTVPSMADMESGYLINIISKGCPEYIMQDMILAKNAIAHMVTGLMRSFNRMNYDIEGASLRLSPDFAMFWNVRVLYHGEAYSRYANEKGVLVGTAFKYPTNSLGEFYQHKYVSYATIVERVDALDISDNDKKGIKQYYRNIGDSVLVMPAIEWLKKQLAGYDFDYDGIVAVWDQEFNAIVETLKSSIVNILDAKGIKGKDNKVMETVVFQAESFGKIFELTALLSDLNIGTIVRNNDCVVAMLTSKEKGKVQKILKDLFERKDRKGNDYTRCEFKTMSLDGNSISVIPMDQESTDAITSRVKEMALTSENITEALKDMSDALRRVGEITIDSPKTGVTVELPWDLFSEVFPAYLVEKKHEIDWKERTMAIEEFLTPKQAKKILVTDLLSEVRNNSFAKLQAAVESVIKSINYSDESLGAYSVFAHGSHHDIVKAGLEVKTAFNYMMNTKDSKVYEPYTVSTLRLLTKDLSPAGRGLFTKYVSMIDNGGNMNQDGRSILPLMFPQEYISMIKEYFHPESLQFAGEEILANKGAYQDGDLVVFENGVAQNAISKMEAISGVFTIKEIDGKLFACEKLDLLLPEPVNNKLAVRSFIYDKVKLDKIKNDFRVGSEVKIVKGQGDNLAVEFVKNKYGDKQTFTTFFANNGAASHLVGTQWTIGANALVKMVNEKKEEGQQEFWSLQFFLDAIGTDSDGEYFNENYGSEPEYMVPDEGYSNAGCEDYNQGI